MPYRFLRSFLKFQGHAGQKYINFDPNWAFRDCNSSLNSLMDLKWCTKLDVIYNVDEVPYWFLGHPSSFKVTKKSTIWIQFEITRPVAAIKSLRFALFNTWLEYSFWNISDKFDSGHHSWSNVHIIKQKGIRHFFVFLKPFFFKLGPWDSIKLELLLCAEYKWRVFTPQL